MTGFGVQKLHTLMVPSLTPSATAKAAASPAVLRCFGTFSRVLPFVALVMAALSAAASAETFRDWRSDCPGAGAGCMLATNVADAKNAWLAGLLVSPEADGTSGMMKILVPPGVHLASGLFVAVGRGKPRQAEFQRCSDQACLATLDLDASQIMALRRATRAHIVYRPRSTTAPVRVQASLMGFSAALAHTMEAVQ
ncbi:Invasion protein IalB, involved in pathogenesis [Roseovarius litoreus]|jgi:invasion protein IalB|uniref:Invasion protein IalB, involved in pathogenesis n=2 Tax=Roseovarius litoreus TaxID=1155722 RepID=A0A1M7FTF4_9RHOB|nr:Invasion protein IalB, involved in pathogenesis [Roseovarius litoreus]